MLVLSNSKQTLLVTKKEWFLRKAGSWQPCNREIRNWIFCLLNCACILLLNCWHTLSILPFLISITWNKLLDFQPICHLKVFCMFIQQMHSTFSSQHGSCYTGSISNNNPLSITISCIRMTHWNKPYPLTKFTGIEHKSEVLFPDLVTLNALNLEISLKKYYSQISVVWINLMDSF